MSIAGEFGIVYKATLNGWGGEGKKQVAVKTLKGDYGCKHHLCNCILYFLHKVSLVLLISRA